MPTPHGWAFSFRESPPMSDSSRAGDAPLPIRRPAARTQDGDVPRVVRLRGPPPTRLEPRPIRSPVLPSRPTRRVLRRRTAVEPCCVSCFRYTRRPSLPRPVQSWRPEHRGKGSDCGFCARRACGPLGGATLGLDGASPFRPMCELRDSGFRGLAHPTPLTAGPPGPVSPGLTARRSPVRGCAWRMTAAVLPPARGGVFVRGCVRTSPIPSRWASSAREAGRVRVSPAWRARGSRSAAVARRRHDRPGLCSV